MSGAGSVLRLVTAASFVCVWAPSFVDAQEPGAKPPLTYAAYDGWRSISDVKLSDDGMWLVYILTPQDGDGELVARNLETQLEHRQFRGKEPPPVTQSLHLPQRPEPPAPFAITSDSQYVIFTLMPPKAAVGQATREGATISERQASQGLCILDLTSGAIRTIDRVKSWKLPDAFGGLLAYLREPRQSSSSEQESPAGTDLVIHHLATRGDTTIHEVGEYAWSKNGDWLAYTVSYGGKKADGTYIWRSADASSHPVLTGQGEYRRLTFDEPGQQLAFLSNRHESRADARSFALYMGRAPTFSARELVSEVTLGMPAGWVVSEQGELKFSKDGSRLYLGTAPGPRFEPRAADSVTVDIWHWQDPLLQPMQKVIADRERTSSYRGVVHVGERRFVQLASEEVPNVDIGDGDLPYAVGSSNLPYRAFLSWDGLYEDLYLVDLRDGSRIKIVERARLGTVENYPWEGRVATLSPAGKYVLWFDQDDSDWLALRVSDRRRSNLTNQLAVRFASETWDLPEPAPAYSVAGWTADDRSVLVYDRYDIWEIEVDNQTARMITNGMGRREGLIFRLPGHPVHAPRPAVRQYLDEVVPADRPVLLSAVKDETKASGFYQTWLRPTGDPAKLIMLEKAVGKPIRAKNADRVVFTLSRFDEFPDLWVTDGNIKNLRRVSDANPQQGEFNWGRSELVNFVNADGKALRAVLIKPENFDPRRKYPLMVRVYSLLSDTLHDYVPPAPGTHVNITRYVSNGYVVLMPDIVYDIGYPGDSALKCVIPAIHEVLRMGFVDPSRIGVQGNSWGGYQISYMVTRTDMFRAVVAGASVVNMVSAYGSIRWGMGMSRAFQYEKGQSRIAGPPWGRSQQFIENSPIFRVDSVTTPYLAIHNDQDEAVPWHQSIEFFSALRRLGKEAYMFNYNGERHRLQSRENEKHWTVHMDEFFDHYLKDAPRPDWMDNGVPYLRRGNRTVTHLFRNRTDDR